MAGMTHQQGAEGLDALLDEALEEFDALPKPGAPAPSAPAAPEPKQAAAAAEGAGAAAPPAAESSAAPSSAPSQPGAGGRGGLAFNPLGSRAAPPRRAAAAQPAAAVRREAEGEGLQEEKEEEGEEEELLSAEDEAALRAAATAAGLGDLGDMDSLSAGLSKLLAELAKVDDETLAQAAADVAAGSSSRGSGAPGAGSSSGGGGSAGPLPPQGDLGATLRALADQAPALGGEAGAGDDPLRGLGDHPGMASLVDSIMQQLLSKDVLYQPMKDIGSEYPAWLERNKETLSPEDHERYRRQYEYIQQITALYESSPGDYPQLINLLQQMQQCGQPPQEIVDQLAPGMQFDAEGLPRFPAGAGGDLPPELADCSIM